MKLYKLPSTLATKVPIGKIVKYIKKSDETLTPKTGIVLKHCENCITLKGLGGPAIWSIKYSENVIYVTKDILDSIKPKPKPKNKVNKTTKKPQTNKVKKVVKKSKKN